METQLWHSVRNEILAQCTATYEQQLRDYTASLELTTAVSKGDSENTVIVDAEAPVSSSSDMLRSDDEPLELYDWYCVPLCGQYMSVRGKLKDDGHMYECGWGLCH